MSDPRAKRYDLADMRRVKDLGEAGWSHREIRRILMKEDGTAPSLDTITRWLSPRYAASAQARALRANARYRERRGYSFHFPGQKTQQFQEAFIKRLDDEGLAATSIAKCARVVFARPWTREAVARVLGRAV